MRSTALAFLFAALLLVFGCSRPTPSGPADEPSGPAWFEDVTEKVGLDFRHDAGPTDRYFLPQITGSGAALFDYDNDGRLDIYLVQNGGPQGAKNRLYHQKPDGHFEDVSAGSGLDVAGYGMGVAIGDVNNDGLPDVFLTEYGRIRLFLNNGDGTFTDVSDEAGLHSNLWGTSAGFVDYDRDGWLDLVVVNYVDYDNSRACDRADGKRDYCSPDAFPGAVTRLYHNRGVPPGAKSRVPRFEDVTLKSGLAQSPGSGLGVVCTTSMATAGPTSSLPTTPGRTGSGSISTTARSRMKPSHAAWPTTAKGERWPTWARPMAMCTATAYATCSSRT